MAGIGSVGSLSIGAAVAKAQSILLGGGPGEYYHYRSYAENREEFQRLKTQEKRLALENINLEIAQTEHKKQEIDAQKAEFEALNTALEMAELEASLQEEINRLRMERVWLVQLIDDEEAILALLLAWPLH